MDSDKYCHMVIASGVNVLGISQLSGEIHFFLLARVGINGAKSYEDEGWVGMGYIG